MSGKVTKSGGVKYYIEYQRKEWSSDVWVDVDSFYNKNEAREGFEVFRKKGGDTHSYRLTKVKTIQKTTVIEETGVV